MKTGIYVRVSTEEQALNGFSIRAQEEKLVNYAVNIKDWNVSNVTTMNNMFIHCMSLTSLILPENFNTSNVKNFGGMFMDSDSIIQRNIRFC